MTDILNIQNAVNEMVASGMGTSSLRDSIGLVRKCMESAKNNQLIAINPCFEIIAPHHVTKRLARFLTTSEQENFLQTVKGDWYEEMFYLMFCTFDKCCRYAEIQIEMSRYGKVIIE